MLSGDRAVADEICREGTNSKRMPGVKLSPGVRATTDPEELAAAARLIVVAVGSREVRERVRRLGGVVDGSHFVVHALGALAEPGDALVSTVLREETPTLQVGALAGPALPMDLIEGRYASMVCASAFERVAIEARRLLAVPPQLRIYTSGDLVGVELAAALSGAYTIAMGMADALEIGAGPRAVLLTRALAEASRLGAALGGEPRTFFGLSGLGNLLVRSSAESAGNSLDFQYGFELGRGDRSRDRLPEGAHAAVAGCRLAARHKVRLPVLEGIAAVIAGKVTPEAAAAAAGDTVAMEE